MLRKYQCAAKTGFLSSLEYRLDYIFTILTAIFPIFIQVFIWTNVYTEKNNAVFGYSFEQMICYAVLCNFVNHLISSNVHSLVNEDIKSGALNAYLLKPVNYIGYRAAGAFGGKITEFCIVSVLGTLSIGFLYFFSKIGISGLHILLFLASILLAFILHFFIFLCFSFAAFWITDTANLFRTFQVVVMVISGSVFPLDIFGELFMKISRLLPFQNLVYVPLNIIMGKLPLWESLQSLLIQIIWAFLFFVLAQIMWKRGSRRYMGIGG